MVWFHEWVGFFSSPLFMLLCVYTSDNEDGGSFRGSSYFPGKLIAEC